MYTLLLVDDEEDVIEVIERKVSWEQIGFHVVYFLVKLLIKAVVINLANPAD